jgi:hypothetical protein
MTKAANDGADSAPPPPPPPPDDEEADNESMIAGGALGLSQAATARLSALEAALVKKERADIVGRVKALRGKIPQAKFAKLWDQAHKTPLQLSANGNVKQTEFLIRLEVIEDMAKDNPFRRPDGKEEKVSLSESGYGGDSAADIAEQKKIGQSYAKMFS